MTFPTGVFTTLGILAYVILWRYIFRQFFKLFQIPENNQEFHEQAELVAVDALFLNCSNSSDKNLEEPENKVVNIFPVKQRQVFNFQASVLIVSPEILPKRDLIGGKSFLVHHPIRLLEEVENFDKILDAYKLSNRCSQSVICRHEETTVRENSIRSGIAKLKNMEVVVDDDAIADMQTSGSNEFRDIDGASGAFEVLECQTTPPDIKPKAQKFFKEEKHLNRMIRRLVAAELIKCCENELCSTMSRAHSETNNRVNWKRNKYNKQWVNFQQANSGLPQKSTHDSDTMNKETVQLSEESVVDHSMEEFVIADITKDSESLDFNDDNEKSDKNVVKRIPITDNDVPISSKGSVHRIKRSYDPENVTSIQEPPQIKTIRTTRAETTLKVDTVLTKCEDAASQTEHMYMLRAVRSCPGGRRCHDHQLRGIFKTNNKTGVKVNPVEINSLAFLYRKSSDNLIYEKGKGSRSPSYVSKPERFRWRYVMPSKVN